MNVIKGKFKPIKRDKIVGRARSNSRASSRILSRPDKHRVLIIIAAIHLRKAKSICERDSIPERWCV